MLFLYRAAAAALAALVLALPVAAQTHLQYGITITGTMDASYQFSGKEGDLISAEAIGVSADLIPVLILSDSNGQQLAQVQSDPLIPGSTTLNARLPLNGDYILKVTELYSKTGDFVLSLSARPIMSARALTKGSTSINIDATPQAFHFSGPAEIHLTSANGAFSAEIHSQPGELIAEMTDLPSAVFALDASGEFEMMLHTSGAAASVQIDYLPRPDLAQTPTASALLTESDSHAD